MWKWFRGDRAKQYAPIEHPRLGVMTFDRREDCWIADQPLQSHAVRLLIVGEPQPEGCLVSHAVEIVDSFDQLQRSVDRLLDNAIEERPKFAHEIKRLAITEICLLWLDRPGDGMIYFSGPDPHHVWRCDYINRQPQSLGFDS
jgi:hypothetical protein